MFSINRDKVMGINASSSKSTSRMQANISQSVVNNMFNTDYTVGVMDDFIGESESSLRSINRDIYVYDGTSGPAADLMVNLPFSDCDLLGVSDPKIMNVYESSLSEFWDEAGEERTPKDRDFGQGEFEEVYKWRSLNDFEWLIVKSVEFPEEYFEAGKSVLSYFGSILRKKYPDTKANVQIKQDGLRVTMIIDLTEGVREVIEKELDKYGLAITKKMTLEEYADNDPLLLIELKSQLNIARMQLENQKLIAEHQNRERDIQIDKLLSLVGRGIQR